MGGKNSWKSDLPRALLKFGMIIGGFAVILLVAAITGGAEAVGKTASVVVGVGIVGYLVWEVIRNLFFKSRGDR